MPAQSTLIHNVTVLDLDSDRQARRGMSIGLREGKIAVVRRAEDSPPSAEQWDRVIDGSRLLAMPGLVNAHSHTYEGFTRGLVVNRPVGLWALYGHPVLGGVRQSPEQAYVRTLAASIEMLRQGVTTVYDDISLFFEYRLDIVEGILRAYRDSGMRALVAIKVMDKRLYDTLPISVSEIPAEWKGELDAVTVPSLDEAAAFSERCFALGDDRVKCGATPSAPQRSTDALLTRQYAMATSARFPYFLHVQETKLQAKQGPRLYGHSMIAHLDALNILGHNTVIIHGVWLSGSDIELLAKSGAGLIHNPVSNLRLGSGVAPLRKLLEAGVPVALGCDGTSSNDSQSILETMKLAAVLHTLTTPEYEEWPTPAEVFRMATQGGARIGLMADRIGTIVVGQYADLVLLDADAPSFRPLNAPINQLVYCPTGVTINSVFVDGRCVFEGGRITTVDERSVSGQMEEWAERYRPTLERTFAIARQLEPAWRRMYLKHTGEDGNGPT
jgi:cytosine/adenosine deaminase-related metal-dependent hydrolase